MSLSSCFTLFLCCLCKSKLNRNLKKMLEFLVLALSWFSDNIFVVDFYQHKQHSFVAEIKPLSSCPNSLSPSSPQAPQQVEPKFSVCVILVAFFTSLSFRNELRHCFTFIGVELITSFLFFLKGEEDLKWLTMGVKSNAYFWKCYPLVL